MRSFLAVSIVLYAISLNTSMAAMEIFGWLVFLVSLFFARSPQPWEKGLLTGLTLLLIWVPLSLLMTPLEKPFWTQFGFMRWIFLLVGMRWALQEVWQATFEEWLTKLVGVVLIIVSAYAVIQSLTGWDFVRPGRNLVNLQSGGIYKAVGFFSMSLTFAYTFGIVFFAFSRPLWRFNKFWSRILLIFGPLALVASMSRGAWVAAAIGVMFFLWRVHPRRFLPAVLAGVCAIAGLIYFYEILAQKILGLVTLKLDHSSAVRLDLWRAYWQMFTDNPIWGVGLFEGDRLLPQYYQSLGITQPFVSHAHNNLLQWLGGAGFLGLCLYICISGLFLTWSWRLTKVSPWGWSLFLAQLFWHLGGLTEANFFDGEVNHCIVFVWSMVWVLYGQSMKLAASHPQPI